MTGELTDFFALLLFLVPGVGVPFFNDDPIFTLDDTGRLLTCLPGPGSGHAAIHPPDTNSDDRAKNQEYGTQGNKRNDAQNERQADRQCTNDDNQRVCDGITGGDLPVSGELVHWFCELDSIRV